MEPEHGADSGATREDVHYEAALQCIRRTSEGWRAGEFTTSQGDPHGWCWYRLHPTIPAGLPGREPMTTLEKVVMAEAGRMDAAWIPLMPAPNDGGENAV